MSGPRAARRGRAPAWCAAGSCSARASRKPRVLARIPYRRGGGSPAVAIDGSRLAYVVHGMTGSGTIEVGLRRALRADAVVARLVDAQARPRPLLGDHAARRRRGLRRAAGAPGGAVRIGGDRGAGGQDRWRPLADAAARGPGRGVQLHRRDLAGRRRAVHGAGRDPAGQRLHADPAQQPDAYRRARVRQPRRARSPATAGTTTTRRPSRSRAAPSAAASSSPATTRSPSRSGCWRPSWR